MVAKRIRVVVSGRVQGVFFRAETARLARARGLGGYVRNLVDGRVEAAFEGEPDQVDDLVAWAHHGPQWARVEHVAVVQEEPLGETEFRITH